MKKREIIEGVIKDYDFPNKGSFELDGKKVIVKGALPGQKVSCMVSKVRTVSYTHLWNGMRGYYKKAQKIRKKINRQKIIVLDLDRNV